VSISLYAPLGLIESYMRSEYAEIRDSRDFVLFLYRFKGICGEDIDLFNDAEYFSSYTGFVLLVEQREKGDFFLLREHIRVGFGYDMI